MSSINLNMERQISAGVGHFEGMRGEKIFYRRENLKLFRCARNEREQRLIYPAEQREIDCRRSSERRSGEFRMDEETRFVVYLEKWKCLFH